MGSLLHIDIEAGVRCKHAEGRSENLKSGSTRQFSAKGQERYNVICAKFGATEKEIIHLEEGSPSEAVRPGAYSRF